MRIRLGISLVICSLYTAISHTTASNGLVRRAFIDPSCIQKSMWLEVLLEEVVGQSNLARLGALDENTDLFDRATFKRHFKEDDPSSRAIVRSRFGRVMTEASPTGRRVRLRCHDPIDKCKQTRQLRAYTHTRANDWGFNEIILVIETPFPGRSDLSKVRCSVHIFLPLISRRHWPNLGKTTRRPFFWSVAPCIILISWNYNSDTKDGVPKVNC